MTEEEAIKICKNIIRSINGDTCYINYSKEQDKEAIETLLELYYKQKEDIMYLRTDAQDLADDLELWQDRCADSIDKDEILKALGYEKNDEEYKRIYNKEELILSLIRTINEECDRLEDIEDQKTMLEIHNIENQRDKYWQDKIRDKIKEVHAIMSNCEETMEETEDELEYEFIKDRKNRFAYYYDILKELLEEE